MHHSPPKDVLVEHVRMLVNMDEGRKRAQLANAMKKNAWTPGLPSSYAASMSTHIGSGGSGSGASAHGSGASGSGCEPSYYPDSPESSGSEGFAKAATNMPNVPPAPGLSLQWQQDEPAFAPDPSLATTQGGVANASSQLEHATDVLKAALANWEACLNCEEARQAEKTLKKGQKAQQVQTPEQPQSMPVKIPVNSSMIGSATTQAKSAAAQKASASASAGDSSALALQALQKALSDLTGSNPGDVAQVPAMAQEDPNMQAVKLLSQHLKKQQEESVQKILDMVQKQQLMTPKPSLDPMASCWPGDTAQCWPGVGGCDGQWMQMPAFGLQQNPGLAATAVGPCGFPSADSAPLTNAYGMPLGMVPCRPWFNQSMLGKADMEGANHRSRYEHQGERRQGGNHHQVERHQGGSHRNGMGPTKAAPAGMNSKTYRINQPTAASAKETLQKHLQDLQSIDPEKVVLVRKINRLGFQSPAALEAHYSKYGKVEKVLVAHSHVKSQNSRYAARLRPSGLGFVVMSNKKEASTILALGPEQVVRGGLDGADVNIRVQRFQHCSDVAEDAMDKDDQEGQ